MERANQVTQDCFAALIQLRQLSSEQMPQPEVLHTRVRGFLDEMVHRASQAGFSPQDAQDMLYALAALGDELALAKDSLRDYWMGNLLQFHYFQENLAGDGFFTRLEAIRKDSRREEVLRVYYLWLVFGFQGRFRIRGGELELLSLTESVQHDLARRRSVDLEVLSPHGERTQESLAASKSTLPFLAFSVAALAVAVLVYGGLRLILSSNVGQVAQEVAAWNQK
jgi:type VI secretion system protein ImpK